MYVWYIGTDVARGFSKITLLILSSIVSASKNYAGCRSI